MKTLWISGVVIAMLSTAQLQAQSNIMSANGEWRGTLLDGSEAIVATNKYGQPTFVKTGAPVADQFRPMTLDGETLADEFNLLCLQTSFQNEALTEAVNRSSLQWVTRDVTIDAVKEKWGKFDTKLMVAPAARVQIWNESLDALKNTPVLSRWRKGMTDTVFSAKRILNPSCGFTVMTTNFRNPDTFLARLEQHLGEAPKKVVTKEKWADGHWFIEESDGSETRVSYSMTDLDKPEQLLHVSITSQKP